MISLDPRKCAGGLLDFGRRLDSRCRQSAIGRRQPVDRRQRTHYRSFKPGDVFLRGLDGSRHLIPHLERSAQYILAHPITCLVMPTAASLAALSSSASIAAWQKIFSTGDSEKK